MTTPNKNKDYFKKLLKTKSGLKCIRIDENNESPFILKEPPWIHDRQVSSCSECNDKFNLTNRKHHCRRCGHIFCSKCSKTKTWLPRMCFLDPVRVCQPCSDICESELDFFNKGIPILTNGAVLKLNLLNRLNGSVLSLCQLSQSHKYIEFDQKEFQDIALESINDFSVTSDVETGKSWLDIFYENSGIRFTSDPNTGENSLNWIRALEKAFSLISINSKPIFN